MKQKNLWFVLIVVVIFAFAIYLMNHSVTKLTDSLNEQEVIPLLLSGSAAESKAEISGLAWYDDNLILLPQYPQVFDETGDGVLFYLTKAEILSYLDGTNQDPLEPKMIQLNMPDLLDHIRNYQGFEAIGFAGTQVFVTIEAGDGAEMQGFLLRGEIDSNLTSMTFDTAKMTLLQPQAKSENHSDESLLVLKDKVITFYEVNGKTIVATPVAHVFDFDLNPIGTIPMTNIEYRITDTALESANVFWGINYFFPGEVNLLPLEDPIATAFGEGQTHAQYEHVERLVKFRLTDSGITLVDEAPLQLALIEDARNWEGLEILDDRGFLIATDKFPETILGFVPFP